MTKSFFLNTPHKLGREERRPAGWWQALTETGPAEAAITLRRRGGSAWSCERKGIFCLVCVCSVLARIRIMMARANFSLFISTVLRTSPSRPTGTENSNGYQSQRDEKKTRIRAWAWTWTVAIFQRRLNTPHQRDPSLENKHLFIAWMPLFKDSVGDPRHVSLEHFHYVVCV